MADATTHMRLRISETLRKQLSEVAETNGRSLNAEIINRLLASLKSPDQITEILNRLSALEGKK